MNSDSKRIDKLCIEAINDIRKVAAEEYSRRYGFNHDISFIQASRVLGAKYFKKNFGKIPINDVIRIVENRKKNRKRR